MAKSERLLQDRQVTLQVNDGILGYLEDLAKTSLYGNSHGEVAEIVLRIGLKQLIDSGALGAKEQSLKDSSP